MRKMEQGGPEIEPAPAAACETGVRGELKGPWNSRTPFIGRDRPILNGIRIWMRIAAGWLFCERGGRASNEIRKPVIAPRYHPSIGPDGRGSLVAGVGIEPTVPGL